MKKILVIAQSEAKAAEAVKLFAGRTAKAVTPGAKRYPRHFEAVVIYHQDPNDVKFMKDLIQRYAEAPIKAFLGKEAFSAAADYKAKAFTVANAADLLASLDSDLGQLTEVMRKIFDAFDKDHSGFIDINELNEVAKELGKALDADELEECMKDLDINKDNKISFEEFSKWWLSGRQGLSPLMRRLLGFKLKTTKLFGSI